MRARREEIVRTARRRQRRRVASALLLATLTALAVVVGRSPLFAISEVRVEGVDGDLAEAVLAAADMQEGQNLFAANLARAEDRVEAVSWVESAEVDQVPPSAVLIRVQERLTAAVVRTDTASWLVDPQGLLIAGGHRDDKPMVIAPDIAVPPLGEPITHPGVRAALAIIGEMPADLRDRVLRYELDGAHVTSVIDTSDVLEHQPELRVVFGSPHGVEQKAAVFRAMLEVVRDREDDHDDQDVPDPVELDVRAPGNPVLRPGED